MSFVARAFGFAAFVLAGIAIRDRDWLRVIAYILVGSTLLVLANGPK